MKANVKGKIYSLSTFIFQSSHITEPFFDQFRDNLTGGQFAEGIGETGRTVGTNQQLQHDRITENAVQRFDFKLRQQVATLP